MTPGELKLHLDVKIATSDIRLVDPSVPTIEDYLREGMASGCHEFRLVPRIDTQGRLVFYMHALGRNSKTTDYVVTQDVVAHRSETGTFN